MRNFLFNEIQQTVALFAPLPLSLSPPLSLFFICTFRQAFKRNYQMLHHGACSQTVTARIRLHFPFSLLAKPISCLWKEGSAGRRQRRGHILPNGHEIKNVLLQIRLQCPLWQCCNCNAWRAAWRILLNKYEKLKMNTQRGKAERESEVEG